MSRDLVIKVSEYTNREGETKGEYRKLGVILDGENGPYALIDPTVDLAGCLVKQRLMNPNKAGNSVLCSIFDREKRGEKKEDGSSNDFQDDKIPF